MTKSRQLDAICIAVGDTEFRLPGSKSLYQQAGKMGGA